MHLYLRRIRIDVALKHNTENDVGINSESHTTSTKGGLAPNRDAGLDLRESTTWKQRTGIKCARRNQVGVPSNTQRSREAQERGPRVNKERSRNDYSAIC